MLGIPQYLMYILISLKFQSVLLNCFEVSVSPTRATANLVNISCETPKLRLDEFFETRFLAVRHDSINDTYHRRDSAYDSYNCKCNVC